MRLAREASDRAAVPRARNVSVCLAFVLLMAACGSPGLYVPRDGSGQDGSPAPPTSESIPTRPDPTTQWEHVIAGLGPDGSVPLATALSAWVAAIGPLPEVNEPPGEVGEDASVESAIRWVLRYWDRLSSAQQETVRAFLDGGEAAASASGNVLALSRSGSGIEVVGPDAETAAEWATAAQVARDKLRTLLGRPLRSEMKVEFRVTTVKPGRINLAFTLAQNAAGEYHKGPMKTCHIWIPPIGQALGGADLITTITHEVMHCYQYELTPVESVLAMPDWYIEASAAWSGEDVVANGEVFGGSVIPGNAYWREWQLHPETPLFARSYDAIGFFAHLKDEGLNVWKLLDPMQRALTRDSFAAYDVAVKAANGEAAIDAWGASYFRDAASGPIWDTRGPGMLFELSAPSVSAVVGATDTLVFGLEPLSAYPVRLDLQAETVTFIAPAARGKIRFSDGSQQNLAEILGRPICTKGSCSCPDGSAGSAHSFVQGAEGVAMVGFTGHTDGIELTIQGYPLDLTCELPPEDFQPPEDCLCPKFLTSLPRVPGLPLPPAVPASGARLRGAPRRRLAGRRLRAGASCGS